jgi:hypothetical protein
MKIRASVIVVKDLANGDFRAKTNGFLGLMPYSSDEDRVS